MARAAPVRAARAAVGLRTVPRSTRRRERLPASCLSNHDDGVRSDRRGDEPITSVALGAVQAMGTPRATVHCGQDPLGSAVWAGDTTAVDLRYRSPCTLLGRSPDRLVRGSGPNPAEDIPKRLLRCESSGSSASGSNPGYDAGPVRSLYLSSYGQDAAQGPTAKEAPRHTCDAAQNNPEQRVIHNGH